MTSRKILTTWKALRPRFWASRPIRERRSRSRSRSLEREVRLAALQRRHLVDDGRPLGEQVEQRGVDPIERRTNLRKVAHG